MYSSAQLINSVIRSETSTLIQSLSPITHANTHPEIDAYTVDASAGMDANVQMETVAERTFASKRIILAGFSQGGVMALFTGLSSEYPLGGIAVVSGFVPLKGKISAVRLSFFHMHCCLAWALY